MPAIKRFSWPSVALPIFQCLDYRIDPVGPEAHSQVSPHYRPNCRYLGWRAFSQVFPVKASSCVVLLQGALVMLPAPIQVHAKYPGIL
jgi:hypothetical protein